MYLEGPYEIERPVLAMMCRGPVSVARAASIMRVTEPTAQTLLHHMESIGIAWQMPLSDASEGQRGSAIWDVTPHGRNLAMGDVAGEVDPSPHLDPVGSRAISGFLSRVWAA
jgi:hypothetical protein